MYLINRSNIRSSQLKSEDVKAIKDYLKEVKAAENLEFVGTEISSYASPDGALELNEKLSEKRAVNSKNYFERELSRAKVEDAKNSELFDEVSPVAINYQFDRIVFKNIYRAFRR